MSLPRSELLQKASVLVLVIMPLLGFLTAVVLLWNQYVFLSDLWLLGALYVLTLIGIGVGYHRMLTHTGFHAPEWLRAIFLILGCMAFEGAPDTWAATHIKHHAHSDEDDDPHSPLHGFWHAHMGWLFSPRNFPVVKEYAPHLLADRTVQFVSKLTLLWFALSLLIPFAIGGWTGLVWGGLLRIFLTTHVTWSVNSVCHTFGRRAFETTDESRNEWIVGLLALGEGWHNNHHAFPRNAFHGMRWWQFDLSGVLIRILERTGLVWDVQRVTFETEIAHRTRAEAMFEALKDMRQSAMVSVRGARAEISAWGARFVVSSLTDTQRSQCHQMQIYAMQRLDHMHDTILTSANLKRQKLEKYQREAQALARDCQERWKILVGDRTAA